MSEETAIPQSVTETPKRASRRMPVLLILMLCLALVAVGQYAWNHRRSPLDIQLHGGFEEAPGALTEILAKTPPDKRLPLLLKLRQDETFGCRYAAVDALGREQGPEVAEALEQAFQDSASVVRQCVLEGIPNVDKERGLRLMLAALRDGDYWIRDYASNQMALLAGKPHSYVDKRAAPMLIKALDDTDESVLVMSVTALRKLTGQKWRYPLQGTPEQKQAVLASCRKWWAEHRASWPTAAELADVRPIQPKRADPAPDFSLRDLDGKRVSLSEQKGRITLLNFWGCWCPPCQKEVPALVQLDKEFQGSNVDIIGVALSEHVVMSEKDKTKLSQWCHDHGVSYRQAASTPRILEDYGDIHEVPVTVLMDGQGRIRYRWDGERDYETFRPAIERVLNESTTKP